MTKQIELPTSPVRVPEGGNITKRGSVPVVMRWQTVHDSWRGTDRSLRFYGKCVVCNRNCWAFDDGENDPRGMLGDNALWTVSPDEDEMVEIRTCAVCANEQEGYDKAKALYRELGAEAVAPIEWPA